MSRLNNKRALITGAASGIGKAIATRFADEGANVLITDIDKQAADKVVEEIDTPQAESFALDVTGASQFQEAIKQVSTLWGGLDILVNNAGYGVAAQTPDTTEEQWQKVIDICMKGTFLGMKYAIPVMQGQQNG